MRPTFPTAGLSRGLQIQGRVIWALLLREVITRFGRRNLGVLWLFLEPMLFTLGVAALWTAGGLHHGSNIPIVAFAITGYSSVLMWRNTVGHCVQALQANFNLLYHRYVLPIDVFLARIVLEVAGASASFLVLSVLFSSLGYISAPHDPLLVAAGWMMLGWFGAALGLCVGAATAFSEIVKRLWTPTAYLLFPLSGAAFMVEWLPPASRELILMLPMVHGVELLREGYFGHAVATHYDMGYMATFNLCLTAVGLSVVRFASRRIEAE